MKQIVLTQGKVVLVNDADYEWLRQWRWHLLPSVTSRDKFYAKRTSSRVTGRQKAILMHRVIMDAPDHLQVHHINHNGLDNQRENLRLCTQSQNSAAARITRANKTSRFRGVSQTGSRWRAQIMVNRKNLPLGTYHSEIKAARAYDQAAMKYFREFANLNGV